jgi:hypothetical protein
MADEYKALKDNGTWRLVPRPPGANVVIGKWIYKHKFHSNGSLARHKARWVVRGFSQQHGIDYDETFSPVIKPATIRVVLSIAASRHWSTHQLDVKNAFLHGHLDEIVYCKQPPSFVDPAHPDHVCLLQRSLYGLKQAPRAWYQRFATYIRQLCFVPSAIDTSLFVYKDGAQLAYLLYVDDIILIASSDALLHSIIGRLHTKLPWLILEIYITFWGFLLLGLLTVCSCLNGNMLRIFYSVLAWVNVTPGVFGSTPNLPQPNVRHATPC